MSATIRPSISLQRWTLADIPWHAIQRERVARDKELFHMVSAASFVEITTHLYTRNLIEYFDGDAEVTDWLEQHWLHEELQHGEALKRYVQIAWPEFDWERTYRDYLCEYSTCCKLEALEATRSMEMAARCVVEMGTASYYTALSRLSPEPVLNVLTRHIREDEVRHYKYFYGYFRRYRAAEGSGRTRVLQALWHRLKMIDGEDAYIALKHVYAVSHPGEPFDSRVYRKLQKRFRHLVGGHFPHQMSAKMLLKPLELGPRAQHIATPILETLLRRLVA